jgi:ABC-type glycerol-3-phosphate transport system substrate-binding protein
MEPYIAQDPSFDKDDYHDLVNHFDFINGERWALTVSATPVVFLYNKDMFEAHGLDPERPPQR